MADLNTSELDKYRRRIIRSVARLLQEKKPPDEVWEIMKTETGCDCKALWSRMRALTVKKLNRLIMAEDRSENIPPVARLSTTDWLLFDLVLVHENIDVIGTERIDQTKAEYKPMFELFSLVQLYGIEDLIQARQSEDLAQAWAAASVYYNSNGRQCSPVLLQRRWYQIKELTRTRFYNFWMMYRGNVNNLKNASKTHMPTRLQMVIAKRYPRIITKEFLTWEELVEHKLIISEDVLQPIMKGNSLRKPNESGPDIIIVEPEIETIDLEADSDLENEYSETPTTSNQTDMLHNAADANITVKEEPLDIESNETIQDIEHNSNLPQMTRIEKALYCEENALDLEESEAETRSDCGESDENLKCDEMGVPSHLQISQIKKIIPPVDNGITADAITREREELLRNFELDGTNTPQITNVCSLSETIEENDSSCDEDIIRPNISRIGTVVSKAEEIKDDVIRFNTETTVRKENIKSEVSGVVSVGLKSSDPVKESVTVVSELNRNFSEVASASVTIDLDFIDDGIEFIDDGIDFIEEDMEQNGKKHDKNATTIDEDSENGNVKFDLKLLMTTVVNTTRLDDMVIFKGKSFSSIRDIDVINHVIAESKIKTDDKECTHSLNIDSHQQENYDDELGAENEIDDQESSSDVDESVKVSQSSYLLKKPISRSYNPIQLCKNPDFNTRLKRLTVGFLSSARNRQLYKACKPMTIDMSKAFESKLVDGTMYLKMCKPGTVKEETQKTVISTATQPASVLPSAISVQSLIDHTVSVELVPQEINQDQDIIIDKPHRPVTEVPTNEFAKPSNSKEFQLSTPGPLCSKRSQPELDLPLMAIDDDGLLTERKKVINLPDIIQVRRINQHLLTAEVSPMRLDKHNAEEPTVVESGTVTEKSIQPEKSTYQHEYTNRPEESINHPITTTFINQPMTTTNKTSLNAIRRQKQKELQEKIVCPSKIKKNVPISWNKPKVVQTQSEALLTSDTLNKMLVLLTGDQNMLVQNKKITKSNLIMEKSIELLGTKPAAKTISKTAINNETNIYLTSKDPDPGLAQTEMRNVTKNKEKLYKKRLKKVAVGVSAKVAQRSSRNYCCWMRLKMEKPCLAKPKHYCQPNECICCCRTRLFEKIVYYWSLNEKMKVRRLLTLASVEEELQFHRQFSEDSSQSTNISKREQKAVLCKLFSGSKKNFGQQTSSRKSQKEAVYVIDVEEYIAPSLSIGTNTNDSATPNTAIASINSPVLSPETVRAISPVTSEPSVPTEPIICTVPRPIISAVSSVPSLTTVQTTSTISTVPGIVPIPTSFLLEKPLVAPPVVHPEIISLDDLPDNQPFDVSPKMAIPEKNTSAYDSIKSNVNLPLRTKQTHSKSNLHSPNILKKSCTCYKSMISLDKSPKKYLVIDGTQVCPMHKGSVENHESTVERKNKVLLLKRKQILMNCKTKESPIFLGKNQILLTTAKLPGSITDTIPKVLTAKVIPSTLRGTLPDGVNFMLLPNGKLTYTIDPKAKLSDDQLASLPALLATVEQQLAPTISLVPEVACNVAQNKDSVINLPNSENSAEPIEYTANVSIPLEHATNVEDNNQVSSTDLTGISNVDTDNAVSTNVITLLSNTNSNADLHSDKENQDITDTQSSNIGNVKEISEVILTNIQDFDVENVTPPTGVQVLGENEEHADNTQHISMDSSENENNNDNKSGEECSNKGSIIGNRKTILSDLMAMSGISSEDTTPNPLTPKQSPTKITDLISTPLNIHSSSELPAGISNVITNLELTPVTSYSILKHSCETNAHFFKLDFDTQLVVPINVCITKKNSKTSRSSQPNTSKRIDDVMIDLTEDVDDTENVSTHVENLEDIVNTNLSVNNLKVYTKRKGVSLVKDSRCNVVKPMRLFKVSHTCNSNNRKRKANPDNKIKISKNMEVVKRRRKQNLCRIEAKIDLVDSDAPMEEEYLIDSLSSDEDLPSASISIPPTASDSDSEDDEPLAKIAQRMNNTNTSVDKAADNIAVDVPEEERNTERVTESTEANLEAAGLEPQEDNVEIAERGMEKVVENDMDVDMDGLSTAELFLWPVNEAEESQEDCILGV